MEQGGAKVSTIIPGPAHGVQGATSRGGGGRGTERLSRLSLVGGPIKEKKQVLRKEKGREPALNAIKGEKMRKSAQKNERGLCNQVGIQKKAKKVKWEGERKNLKAKREAIA